MSPITYIDFASRMREVESRIHTACERAGRNPQDVRLLPVTKTHGPWAVEYAWRYGLKAVGENRVQEAVEKQALAGEPGIGWELIGSLQSNKARLAVKHFSRVQSVDRPKIVQALQRQCVEQGRERLPVLLQVNAGNDPAKQGAAPDDAEALLRAALDAPALLVEGLMTIAPLDGDPEVARRTFARLREIRDTLEQRCGVPLPELSMGMSGDLDAAVMEGSTLIRVGTALYGAR